MIPIKEAVKAVLASDNGMGVESQEGALYVRSLEGAQYVTGGYGSDGEIEWETEYDADLDAAVDEFLKLRNAAKHRRGSKSGGAASGE